MYLRADWSMQKNQEKITSNISIETLPRGLGWDGRGHTTSANSGLQNSLIWSYRYHCLCRSRPCGGIKAGRDSDDGEDLARFTTVHCVSATYFLHLTVPSAEKWNWWKLRILGSFLKNCWRYPVQSYIHTCGASLSPTIIASLLWADDFTTYIHKRIEKL